MDVCGIALLRTDSCILTPQMLSRTGSGRPPCGNTPGGRPRTMLSCIGIAPYAFRRAHLHSFSISTHPYIVPLPLGNIHDRLACHVHPHTPVTLYSILSVVRGALEDLTRQATVGRGPSGFPHPQSQTGSAGTGATGMSCMHTCITVRLSIHRDVHCMHMTHMCGPSHLISVHPSVVSY